MWMLVVCLNMVNICLKTNYITRKDNNSKSFSFTNLHYNAKPLYVTTPSITHKSLGHLINHWKVNVCTQIFGCHLFFLPQHQYVLTHAW